MREILKPVFINGACVYDSPSVMEIAAYCAEEKKTLWDETKTSLQSTQSICGSVPQII